MIPDKAGYVVLYVKQAFAEEATDLEGAANQLVGLVTPEFKIVHNRRRINWSVALSRLVKPTRLL